MSVNQVRIIAGDHRRRLLHFPDRPGLRPTPDRVRETLFNWLGQDLEGMRCLDLFAGSGALGLEAASRGAAEVVLVERDAATAAALNDNIRNIGIRNCVVRHADGLAYLRGAAGQFDVIFLDPPFASDVLAPALREAATHLCAGGRIYAEFGQRPVLEGYRVLREGRAGKSHYCLMELA